MANRLSSEEAAKLLAANLADCQASIEAKAAWDASLRYRGAGFLRSNEAGLLVQEIADHCGCSVGLVKLEIGKAKKARGEPAAATTEG